MSRVTERGAIYNEEKYLRGKLLDHSGWTKILPRKITPSDIDMAFDNAGKILIVELNSKSCKWDDLQYGQRLLYRDMVALNNDGQIIAACCHHADVPRIDTVKDILAFSVMYQDKGEIKTSEPIAGSEWVRFVEEVFGIEVKA